VFFEIPRGPEWATALQTVVDALHKTGGQRSGIKLRCGGAEAAAIPTFADVAHAITICRDSRRPLKFTAVDYPPPPHLHETLHTSVHGVLNVFAAGVMAQVHDLSADQLTPILEAEDPAEFRFDAERLQTRQWSATPAQIEGARRQLVLSFGSCSFDEPRDDL